MKKTYLAFAFAAATLLACNSGTSSNTADSTTTFNDSNNTSAMNNGNDTSATTMNSMNTDTKPVSDMDKQFMMDAAAAGNTEVMAGQVAQNMAKNDRVKNFANMMVNDHTKAGNELKTLASQKNVTLPDSVMPKQHDALEGLRKTSAKNFDKEYIDMMVKDHKEAVSKFQMASEKCDNGDVKTWAANTLPTLKMHLDSAQAIQKALK
ncbi:DUF4142 domain-containing protein [Ilyomonas limi]|jgi:putative membrane protein|uniref:DUF4142 domain-containing protein n=1 Tax=Ilyomonas limi TaxID=2575867 RepID=A0A4U3KU29_9BACT|nr:DUF4142 domain-containing protein [Ilyomonas limi]TKK64416.1 DUF4142 domain-containing protein [Ilyomonas limi]